MWNGSPRLAHFAEAAFRASTIAACFTATMGPATAQTSQRVTVAGQVLPRCWASATADKRTAVAARCSSRSTQVEIALDELGDGRPRPCASKTEEADAIDCEREKPATPRRVTVTPKS
jgi:hypothetical protein